MTLRSRSPQFDQRQSATIQTFVFNHSFLNTKCIGDYCGSVERLHKQKTQRCMQNRWPSTEAVWIFASKTWSCQSCQVTSVVIIGILAPALALGLAVAPVLQHSWKNNNKLHENWLARYVSTIVTHMKITSPLGEKKRIVLKTSSYVFSMPCQAQSLRAIELKYFPSTSILIQLERGGVYVIYIYICISRKPLFRTRNLYMKVYFKSTPKQNKLKKYPWHYP